MISDKDYKIGRVIRGPNEPDTDRPSRSFRVICGFDRGYVLVTTLFDFDTYNGSVGTITKLPRDQVQATWFATRFVDRLQGVDNEAG